MPLLHTAQQAITLLKAGDVVAIPTETVYGLAADATQESAILQVFSLKQRPKDHPLIVHVADQQQIAYWAKDISPLALALCQAFWPGPLTLVLKVQEHVSKTITGGQESIALRCPAHPLTHQILAEFRGLVAPSANRYKEISPTCAEHILSRFSDKVSVLQGGPCAFGIESTILDVRHKTPVLLRPGAIPLSVLETHLGGGISKKPEENLKFSGQHTKHYAPRTRTELASFETIPSLVSNASENNRIGILSHLPFKNMAVSNYVDLIMLQNDPSEYAKDLYAKLHELDAKQLTHLYIVKVPENQAWYAVNDRLKRITG